MKTCGECKNKNCPEEMPDPNSMACKHFKGNKITNGDLIRQMSNVELADFVNNRCNYCYIKEVYECDGKSCFYGVLAYLNAPAESEVEE